MQNFGKFKFVEQIFDETRCAIKMNFFNKCNKRHTGKRHLHISSKKFNFNFGVFYENKVLEKLRLS